MCLSRIGLALVCVFFSLAGARAETLRLVAAGSLNDAINILIADYQKTMPGVSIETVWGPSGVLRDRLEKGEPFDLFASAALPHAEALTNAGLSGPSVLFLRNKLCVLAPGETAVTRDTLVERLLNTETKLATSTPTADPGGDYTWEFFHRIDRTRPGAFDMLAGKAQQLFGGATTTTPVVGRHRLELALDEKTVDLAVYYCSGVQKIVAGSAKYKKIDLPDELNVGAEYGLTVSRKAPPAASDFAMYLLSPAAQTVFTKYGFIPVSAPGL
jgi:ABC-type molybdate transport system substrate-binding protein